MLGRPRLLVLARFALPFLFGLWLFSLTVPHESAYTRAIGHVEDEKEVFISNFLESEIDGGFDGRGIADLCATKTWTPGLVLSCEPAPGGPGHVKNAHLNCIRIAIEMGAELVVPRIVKRHDTQISLTTPYSGAGPVRGEPFDYLFDLDHLDQSLARFCPQMKVYRSMDELYDVPSLQKGTGMSLQVLEVPLLNGSVISDTSVLSRYIKKYIDHVSPPENRTQPVRFNLGVTNWAFTTSSDSPVFSHQFGRIIRTRQGARRLSASALHSLQRRFGFQADPHGQPENNAFVGVHLRTEEDARYILPKFETQARRLLDYIVSSGMKVAYLATGAEEAQIAEFERMAADLNVTVVTKKQMLHGDELRALNALTWDQRALVDYEVMLRAGLVVGPAQSSFSWGLALRRSGFSGASRPAPVVNLTMEWEDGLTTLLGPAVKGPVLRQTIWP
ncbi:hypothetical protein QBC47DRAFT_305698 [Echria macrotheca]|uniref:Alternative oxidase n=1 Tax=Echria macrotheca TaxID=438768 RepID=A0AAJ0BAS4_9PEZI|nr:hypothetical protein QBC47DRAFT_305698 [Echria macrotheca]